jgi:16S rRNA A1518/A1519 N6-dimethyltransferase RsmA/KsgA/DIM1 with predicted DNA glycosylase/AP lyase activity
LFRLTEVASQLRDLHVMLQKEVVARMTFCAKRATPDYGRLSVMLQAMFQITRIFVVPPGAFQPVPQVDSAVARLVPLARRRRMSPIRRSSHAWSPPRARGSARPESARRPRSRRL